MLRSHILFLEEQGYEVSPVTNGDDAVALVSREQFDVVLLDQMMSGKDGLTTLSEIHNIAPGLPVIMITKHEEESLMEEALGGDVADFLIKPVNPSQILLACKRILEGERISGERLTRDYPQEFQRISNLLMAGPTAEEWTTIHTRLSQWDIDLEEHGDPGLRQAMADQRRECNVEFGKFIEREYMVWVQPERKDSPPLSVDVVTRYLYPHLKAEEQTAFIVVDCMRLDQWLMIEPLLYDYFNVSRDYYFAILPSATPYARNAIFSGLFPVEIQEQHPELWVDSVDDATSLNRFERQLLNQQLTRLGLSLQPEPKYVKVLDVAHGRNLERQVASDANMPLLSVVVNFVDILAHSRSDSEVLREIAPDEAGYRALTRSWFEHSWLFSVLRQLAEQGRTVIVTTDHGSVRALHPAQVIGDRETSTSLRYKYGRSLKCDSKQAIFVKEPRSYRLPQHGLNTTYIFAKEDYFFLYPTNYHKYLNKFQDSFQHGGASLEETILPVVTLRGKG